VNAECEAVRRALEDEPGASRPELAGHLAECRGCAAHAGLVSLLAGLNPGEGDEEAARRILVEMPIARWQLRRASAWAPLAVGGVLVGGGVLLAGGLPGGATLATLPSGLYSLAAASALDVAAAARGSADAVRSLVTAGGFASLAWLAGSALAGTLALRALLRRASRGRA
jgi:hypothetical protein